MTRPLTTSAILSSVLVLPFVILEIINRGGIDTRFPVVLFALMWGLAFVFFAGSIAIARNARAGIMASPLSLAARIVILLVIAVFWTGLAVDQMPCFLGVPDCD